MKSELRHALEAVVARTGIAPDLIIRFVEFEWIIPIDWEHRLLDEEDIARARLIWELQRDFGVNDEAVPVILHLIDQLNRGR